MYQTSAGGLAALDWEQQDVENLESQEGVNGIACVCGNVAAPSGASRGWHGAWVLLQCKICAGRYYFSSANRYRECAQCKQQLLDRADSEAKILKLVCGRSHLVPKLWAVQEKDGESTVRICEARFGWKPDKKQRRR